MKVFTHNLRFKDRGHISASYYRDRHDDGKDCLELVYSDSEKEYTWNYYWDNKDVYAIDIFKTMHYETLKCGFLTHRESHQYKFHKGEYMLMKESIMIFISHLEIYVVALEKICNSATPFITEYIES